MSSGKMYERYAKFLEEHPDGVAPERERPWQHASEFERAHAAAFEAACRALANSDFSAGGVRDDDHDYESWGEDEFYAKPVEIVRVVLAAVADRVTWRDDEHEYVNEQGQPLLCPNCGGPWPYGFTEEELDR